MSRDERATSPASLPQVNDPAGHAADVVGRVPIRAHRTGATSSNPQPLLEGSLRNIQTGLSCSGSVSGHAQNDRSGKCCWCGVQVDPPVPAPRLGRAYRTELDLAYRRHFDPDWGTDPFDA